jgi:hypothetical protein
LIPLMWFAWLSQSFVQVLCPIQAEENHE